MLQELAVALRARVMILIDLTGRHNGNTVAGMYDALRRFDFIPGSPDIYTVLIDEPGLLHNLSLTFLQPFAAV